MCSQNPIQINPISQAYRIITVMSAWEYSCHVEVYKWCLDDCQDDEVLLWDPTRLLIYTLQHAGRILACGDLNISTRQCMAVYFIDKETSALTACSSDPSACSASSCTVWDGIQSFIVRFFFKKLSYFYWDTKHLCGIQSWFSVNVGVFITD